MNRFGVKLGRHALAAQLALVVLALVRLTFGRGREQPLAPAMAGAIVGFLCVGAFDSLLDVPSGEDLAVGR